MLVLMPRTDPSPMANWTMPVCRLLNMYQPNAPSAGSDGLFTSPHPVGRDPPPIHEATDRNGGIWLVPVYSPNMRVFAAPSADVSSSSVTLDRSEKMPTNLSLVVPVWPRYPITP